MNSHLKLGLDDAAYTPRKYSKVYYSHNEDFEGGQAGFPIRSENILKRQRKEIGLGVLLWLGDGAWVKIPMYEQEFT